MVLPSTPVSLWDWQYGKKYSCLLPLNLLPLHRTFPHKHKIFYKEKYGELRGLFTELINLALNNLLFFALHLESGGVFPKPLSAAEEEECFKKMGEGDSAARNKLIEHNLRLVAHIIKKYYNVTTDQEDLISIGTIGLIKAVSTFDYAKKTRFATYASRCIENATITVRLTKEKPIYRVFGEFSKRLKTVCIFFANSIRAGRFMRRFMFIRLSS